MEIPLKATFLDLDLLTVSAVIMFYVFKTTVSQCDVGYKGLKETGTCIKLVRQDRNWNGARQLCQKEGGDLVRILDATANEAIYNNFVRNEGERRIWIGMIKRGNKYQWLNEARKVTFIPWAPGQPNHGDPPVCISMNYFGNSEWTDDSCHSGEFFLCEKFPVDCSFESDGFVCKKNCTGKCKERPNYVVCDDRTGNCWEGCGDGYLGVKCDTPCNKTYYGLNCAFNCSTNCGGDEGLCNHESGNCTTGCKPGFMFEDTKCYSECPNGTYGLNCTKRCSPFCGGPDQYCKKDYGECLAGCVGGFTGAQCLVEKPVEEGMGAGVIFGILFLILAVLTTILLLGRKKKHGAEAAEEEAKPKPIPKEPTKSSVASKERGSNASGAGRSGEKEASQGSRRSGDSGGGQD